MFKLALLLLLAAPAFAAGPTPAEILAKADEVRNPQIDYTVKVTVTSVKPDGAKKAAQYEVLVKGREKSLVKTLAPANERGTSLLQIERGLWSFLPTLSQPVRLSLQQRLIGDVANGDIARANFAADYDAKLLRQDAKHYILELKAKTEDVTYAKIVYRVQKADFHPVGAEFFAVSGKLLKTCSYERYAQLAGRLRPSRMVMKDPLVKGQSSTVEYERFDVAELPEKIFTKDYLKKLKY